MMGIGKVSVEDVVSKYKGNKKDIAQAAQFALIDPTTAVMAGMYIDRIREAEALEKEQAATVAEQVFSPKPEPEAVSQMQLAQQGLGGAPAPAPKMPMAPRPPSGMAFPKPPQGIAPNLPGVNMGMGGTPQAAQMQAMQQQMAPRPSVAGMNQIPVNPNMVANAASGGLVAFAGGGEIQGYATGTEGTLSRQMPAYADFLKGYTPPDSNPADVYATQEEIIRADLPEVNYDRVQKLVSPEAVAEKKAELEERTGQRYSDDIALNMILGGLSAAEGKPSTGNVFSDIIGSVSTAGKAAAPGIIQATRDRRTGEDKALGLEEAAAMQEVSILGAQRQEQLKIKELALTTGDKQLQRQATEKAALLQGAMQAYIAKMSAKTGFPEKQVNAKIKTLTTMYEKNGYDVTDSEVQQKIVDQAFTIVQTQKTKMQLTATEIATNKKFLRGLVSDIEAEYTPIKFANLRADSNEYNRAGKDEKERMRLATIKQALFNKASSEGISIEDLMQANIQSKGILNPESQLTSDDKNIDAGRPGGGAETNDQKLEVGSIVEYKGANYEILAGKKLKDTKTNKIYTNQGGELVEVQ